MSENDDGTHNTEANMKSDNKFHFKLSPEMKKLKTYQHVLKTMNWVETTGEVNDEERPTGAISFSLPCAALYDRTVKNEIKRLEIEIYNKKILEIYDNPNLAVAQYEEELKKLKIQLLNK